MTQPTRSQNSGANNDVRMPSAFVARLSGHRVLMGLFILVAVSLRAAPIERELGENLRYVRVHTVPDDLPAQPSKKSALILDLRYAGGDTQAGATLDTWVKTRAGVHTPVFVLLNPETSPALSELFFAHRKQAGVITLGRAAAKPTPDIVIAEKDEDERRAFDALEHDTPIETLITENADKPRLDEAAIMRARSEQDGVPSDSALPDNIGPSGKKPETSPPPVIDRTLQRAVQLHRALLALKRL